MPPPPRRRTSASQRRSSRAARRNTGSDLVARIIAATSLTVEVGGGVRSTADVQRQVGPAVSMDIGIRGDSFLGNGADGKLLQVLRDTSAHLKANDGAAIRGDIQRLADKADEVLGVRALNGAKQNRLEAALGRLQEIEGTTLQQLSDTEDVDIAKAMIEFSSQKAAYDAALKAGANIVQASLMDFLR